MSDRALSPRGLALAVALLTVSASATACSKPSKPGASSDFIAPIGAGVEPVCVPENDGQKYTLEGYFGLPSTLDVDEKGKTSVDFFFEGPGKGRGMRVAADFPGEVEVGKGSNAKTAGFRRTQSEIDPASFRVEAKGKKLTAADKARVTVKVEVIQHFQTKAVTACVFRYVEAEKS